MDQLGLAVADQQHEPLMFLSGTFGGAAMRWATVEKEAFALVETVKRADYLLRRPGGFRLFTDHRGIFSTQVRSCQRFPSTGPTSYSVGVWC